MLFCLMRAGKIQIALHRPSKGTPYYASKKQLNGGSPADDDDDRVTTSVIGVMTLFIGIMTLIRGLVLRLMANLIVHAMQIVYISGMWSELK